MRVRGRDLRQRRRERRKEKHNTNRRKQKESLERLTSRPFSFSTTGLGKGFTARKGRVRISRRESMLERGVGPCGIGLECVEEGGEVGGELRIGDVYLVVRPSRKRSSHLEAERPFLQLFRGSPDRPLVLLKGRSSERDLVRSNAKDARHLVLCQKVGRR